eukprot:CAMPEP_0114663960 /NCGR_PEP_ID=MMETSP0191-20121206/27950_1 /TAXON_ID=126664 /ORGANISM="Sorites sp." /LENGTH=307 /DNA_ID=CAMNT_0001904865 /DNA_START=58 /DNA_END=981 /DNA_ORIENTATION=+
MARFAVLAAISCVPCSGTCGIYYSTNVVAAANTSCQNVMEEIKARVKGDWRDPGKGYYSLLNESSLELDMEHVKGNFTDQMTFTFQEVAGQAACAVHGCSASPWVKNFSEPVHVTDYCNIFNLFCGSKSGCKPVKHDFTSKEIAADVYGRDDKTCIHHGARPMLRASSPKLLGSTVDDTLTCINSNCPLDETTLSPRPSCVLSNCSGDLTKCLFSSSCRNGVMCEMKCTEPLAKTEEAVYFHGFMECMRVKCPGFPPSKSCAAVHCGVEAASCALHSKCRETLECADKCVPEKYTAALAAMPQTAVI